MNIQDLEKEFSELQEQSDASMSVIIDLQKKIKKLEEDKKHLELLLEGAVPDLSNKVDNNLGIKNERIICETQIFLLKKKAISGSELTLEEARKLQIYVDVLEKLDPKDEQGLSINDISTEDLLKLVHSHESNGN